MIFDREKFFRPWILLMCVLFLHCIQETDTHCSRPLSRIVRNQLAEHFYSVFEERNQEPYSKCPFHASRDLYRIQEGNKTHEYAAKWICNFCGKAFHSEHYLDKHFDNRHSDKLVKGSTVCLADFCDIFRCDVFDGQRKDYFWEKKLCKEDELIVRKRRCEALMRSCLPQGNLSVEQEFEIFEAIGSNTCSLLNCRNYWNRPYKDIPAWKIVLYAVVSPFFFMGLIVYYYAIWDYYFGDYPVDINKLREEEENVLTFDRFRGTSSHLRKRYGGRTLVY